MILNGKTAIVTGASRGIGRAIALALARAGADVVINCLGQVQAAEGVAEEIRAAGRRALVVRADVSDSGEAAAMVERAVKEFGRIDILVNNAGITRDNLLLRMREDDWDAVIDVNLKGAFNCTKAAVRYMIKSRFGRIINISSVVGLFGNAGQVNYAASKAGLIGFAKALARELGPRNITVNTVAPGFIATDMTEQLAEKVKVDLLSRIPLGRFGSPEEVAGTVVFLASDVAAYITGQVIVVDGGMAM